MHCSNCLSHCSRSWYAVLAFTLTHSHYQVRRNAKICLSKLCSLAVDGGEELQSVLLEEFKALLRVQEVSIFYLLRLRKYLHCYGFGVKKCNSTIIGINETEYEKTNRVQRVPVIFFFFLWQRMKNNYVSCEYSKVLLLLPFFAKRFFFFLAFITDNRCSILHRLYSQIISQSRSFHISFTIHSPKTLTLSIFHFSSWRQQSWLYYKTKLNFCFQPNALFTIREQQAIIVMILYMV